ncbi:MAG: phage tail tape measure C-terminal domain-containing protein [Sulfuricella sp.]
MSERNDIRIDVVGDADSFEASTRGAASELDAVKRQILDMAAKAQGATGATRALGVEQERLAAAARASRDALEREAAAKRASRDAAEGAARATAGMSGSMGGAATRNIQNIAYQLQDFVVQVNGGVDAMRAMSQQLPQMMVGMGVWGAAIGLVATLLPNFIQMAGGAEDRTKALKDAQEKLNDALGEVGQTVKKFDMDGLYEEFNKADAATRRSIISQLEFQKALIETQRVLASKKFGESLSGLTDDSQWARFSKTFNTSAVTMTSGWSDIVGSELGVRPDFAKELLPALESVKRGTRDANSVFEEFGRKLLDGNQKAITLAKSLSEMAKIERDTASAQNSMSEAHKKISTSSHVTTKKEANAKGKREKADDSVFQDWYAGFKEREKAAAAMEKERQQAEALLESYKRQDDLAGQRIARGAELASMSERERMASEAVYRVEDESSRRREQIIRQITDEATRTAALAEEKALLAGQIERVREASLASYDAQRSFEFGWEKAFQRYQDAAGNAAQRAQDVFTTATEGMANAMTEFAMTGKLSFQNLANDVIRQIIRMNAQAAASGMTKLLGGLVQAAVGYVAGNVSASSTYGTNFGSQQTQMLAAQDAGFGGMRANGGDVSPFKTYLVGERGPELLRMGAGGGSVVPNEAIGGGGTSVEINIINKTDAQTRTERRSDGKGNQFLEVIIEQVNGRIAGDIGRGSGPVPAAMQSVYGLQRTAGAY